jgi:predicted lipopolysaccharide heptosyltransferase III
LGRKQSEAENTITQLPDYPITRLPGSPRILLIRLREIGDVIFTTPAVRALREHFADAHITYIVEPQAADVVRSNPHIDELIIAPRQHLLADIALGRRLRAGRYDLAIDFHGGPRASLLTWLSGARVRVGYEVAGRAWMYTRRVARPRQLRPRHAVQNQWDLLTTVGIAGPDEARWPVEMPVDPGATAAIAGRLARAGVGLTDRLVVVHVSAGNPFRRWPQSAFAALVASLASRDPGLSVIVTSGPSEREAAGRVVEGAQARLGAADRERVLTLGELSLAELRGLLDRATLYIGGDSGPLHIAATSAIPIVALYGPTLPVRSAPWRNRSLVTESVEIADLACRPCDQRVCAPGDFRCLTRISPEDVIAAAERALTRSGHRC